MSLLNVIAQITIEGVKMDVFGPTAQRLAVELAVTLNAKTNPAPALTAKVRTNARLIVIAKKTNNHLLTVLGLQQVVTVQELKAQVWHISSGNMLIQLAPKNPNSKSKWQQMQILKI